MMIAICQVIVGSSILPFRRAGARHRRDRTRRRPVVGFGGGVGGPRITPRHENIPQYHCNVEVIKIETEYIYRASV